MSAPMKCTVQPDGGHLSTDCDNHAPHSGCESCDHKLVTELDVSVISRVGKTASEKCKVYNPRLAPIREAVLNTLCTVAGETTHTLYCLDAVAGTGVAGLQWKKRLRNKVHVTIAEKEHISEVKGNCDRNNLCNIALPLDMARVPGEPLVSQGDEEVHTCGCTAPILLHMEAFDFVYLHPHGNLGNNVDAAMSNIRNNGVLCLVASDSTHQFTRSAVSIRRHFGATVKKTEYLKELAARVIISSVASAAVKCNKGIEVLYVQFVEDFFLVAVRVLRGPKYADVCVERVRHLLHCQMCEERAFYPNTTTPTEEPYRLLACNCQVNTPGKTAVVLGPMWSGELFSSDLLGKNLATAREGEFSSKLQTVWDAMLDEVRCSQCVVTMGTDVGDPPPKRYKSCSHGHGGDPDQMPPFYFNILRRKWKGINVPKFPKLLELLRTEGYRASRTHFDCGGIRTNASLAIVTKLLSTHCKLKPLQ